MRGLIDGAASARVTIGVAPARGTIGVGPEAQPVPPLAPPPSPFFQIFIFFIFNFFLNRKVKIFVRVRVVRPMTVA